MKQQKFRQISLAIQTIEVYNPPAQSRRRDLLDSTAGCNNGFPTCLAVTQVIQEEENGSTLCR